MIILFFWILIWSNDLDGAHFNGGTITWAPVYPSSNSSPLLITITQSYSWVQPKENCTINVPRSSGGNVNLSCVANCSTQGGYATQAISILTDCTSSSASLGYVLSQRSVNISLNASTYFWIGHRGSAWRTLQNAVGIGWSLVSLIDLRRRSDGLINTPPIAEVTSPQFVMVNRTTLINILVSDVNVGDDLRCRWSKNNNSYGVDECGGVCPSVSLTNLATLSGCTLTFTATIFGVWYAIAIQLEDFVNTTSASPISSVPIQFLIYVLPIPNCSQLPLILNLTDCLEVQVNVSVTFTLYAMNYCDKTITIITDLSSTVGITGMTVSSLVNSTTNTSLSYVTLTWTPQTNQIGPQQFCAVAYTNERVQSDTYCVTFIVTTSIPCITITNSTSTQTTTTTTQTTATTATTVTTTTETTTTITTGTSMTTTSATTTTETTTITDNWSQKNLPLIVGLSVFGVLLTLGCCYFWLYGLKYRKNAAKSNNTRNKQVCQSSYSNTKYDDDMRKRASRFGGITITKIKTDTNKGKPLVDHSMSGIRPNNGKNATLNRVTVVSLKKQQS